MSKYTLTEQEFEKIPEGSIYEAEIVAVGEKEMPFTDDDGNPVIKVDFEFVITDGQFTKRRMWGNVSPWFTTHPDCRYRLWVQEILGRDSLPADFELETDDLIGLPCRIVVGHRKSGREFVSDVIRTSRSGGNASDVF